MLTVENNVASFLGGDISRKENGNITMMQAGLIDRIIEALGLNEANFKVTPVTFHTRPDIALVVRQCARYSFCPQHSHKEALKRIGRYLKGTRDKGITMKPKKSLKLDLFADADFAGLWSHKDQMDPTSMKSHSGWLFTIGGSPIAWVSRL